MIPATLRRRLHRHRWALVRYVYRPIEAVVHTRIECETCGHFPARWHRPTAPAVTRYGMPAPEEGGR